MAEAGMYFSPGAVGGAVFTPLVTVTDLFG